MINRARTLLSADGRAKDAEAAYRRSVEILEELYRLNPGNIEIKTGFAGSLCSVGRFAEARKLVNEVLAVVPRHPYANQLDNWLRSNGH